MKDVEIKDIRIGDRAEFYMGESSRVLEVDYVNQVFRADYLDKTLVHKRDEWVPLNRVTLCQRSTVPSYIAESIMNDIKQS